MKLKSLITEKPELRFLRAEPVKEHELSELDKFRRS